MGWLFSLDQTKNELIKHLTTGWENECGENNVNHSKCSTIKYVVHGNHLWVVFERVITEKETGKETYKKRFIALYLLAKDRGYGYGYKDMDEYCGPSYYDCPLYFLELAPYMQESDPSGWCKNWREGVRNYWKLQNEKKNKKKNILEKLKIGTRIFIEGCKPNSFVITGINGKDVSGEEIGTCLTYRIRPKHLAKATIIMQTNDALVTS